MYNLYSILVPLPNPSPKGEGLKTYKSFGYPPSLMGEGGSLPAGRQGG